MHFTRLSFVFPLIIQDSGLSTPYTGHGPVWNLLEFDELASTNTLAGERLARGEARHGEVIIAKHQTAGRGRASGRVWDDEPGASLLMSVVLTNIPDPAHLLQYRAALAVLSALRNLTGQPNGTQAEFRLKWPNDILLNDKKVCGILLEAQWQGAAMRSAIIGIGINVRQQSFPAELKGIATALFIDGIDVPIVTLRDRILSVLETELFVAPVSELLARIEAELHWLSRIPSLEVAEGDERRSGLHYEGLDESGAMRLRDAAGVLHVIRSGSLLWKQQNG